MKPHTIDTSGWTDADRVQVRSEAVYSGYDVIDDPCDETMIVAKSRPIVKRKPKERFFQ